MQIKAGSKINGIQPEIILALFVADSIYKGFGVELVVTEVTGAKHRAGSLHYVGFAADLRTRYFKDNGKEAAKLLKEALNEQYDVVLESDHIHLEYQPKTA